MSIADKLNDQTSKIQEMISEDHATKGPGTTATLTRTLREDATFRTYFFNLTWMAYWLVYTMLVAMYGLQYMLGTLQSPAFTAFILFFFFAFPYVMDALSVYTYRTFLSILRMFARGNAMYNYTPDDIRNS